MSDINAQGKGIIQGLSPYRHELFLSKGVVTLPKAGEKPLELDREIFDELSKTEGFQIFLKNKTYRVLDYMPASYQDSAGSIAAARAKQVEAESVARSARDAENRAVSENKELKAKLKEFEGLDVQAKKISKIEKENQELKEKLAKLQNLAGKTE
jgi:hypothetical protein